MPNVEMNMCQRLNMWLCVSDSELEVGWVSILHKRQIRVSNFPCCALLCTLLICSFLPLLRSHSVLCKIIISDYRDAGEAGYCMTRLYFCWGGSCGDFRKAEGQDPLKTKTKMSAIKLVGFQLYNLLVWLYHRPVYLQAFICDSAYFGGYV